MTADGINDILKQFSLAISLPSLSLNSENSCTLRVDGAQDIQLMFNEQRNSLDFFTQVGMLPEKDEDRYCDCLLKANAEWDLTQGTTLSKKEGEYAVVLQYPLPALNLTLDIFERVFKHFLQQADMWKTYIQDMGQGILPEPLAELQ